MVWVTENWGTPMSIGDIRFGGVRLSEYAIMLTLTCYSATNISNCIQKKDRLFGAERIVKNFKEAIPNKVSWNAWEKSWDSSLRTDSIWLRDYVLLVAAPNVVVVVVVIQLVGGSNHNGCCVAIIIIISSSSIHFFRINIVTQQPIGQLQGPQNEHQHNTFWSCNGGGGGSSSSNSSSSRSSSRISSSSNSSRSSSK